MLENAAITFRLNEMRKQADPALRWDENCEGSARALVVFVGPSPGRHPDDKPRRRRLRKNYHSALWNESYTAPLRWSTGFRASSKPVVEALLCTPYPKASKLIGRANFDFLGNPKSKDVPEEGMREGAPSVLKMIADCAPELVVPMDKKTFWILQDVMEKDGFTIAECDVKESKVRISNGTKKRLNRKIYCFRATSRNGHSLVVIKLPQHPARMFQADYGTRSGKAVRAAARQIESGQRVDVSVT